MRSFGDSIPLQVVLQEGEGILLGELRPRQGTPQDTQRQVQG
jgi:hypothetical protein